MSSLLLKHYIPLLKNPWHCLSFGFGSGLCVIAPGTVATLCALPFMFIFSYLPIAWYLIIVVLSCCIGVKCCGLTAQAMGVDDPGAIVWDEFTGLFIAGISLYFFTSGFAWVDYLFITVVFRVFDIIKPFPVNWADENFHGGIGIMFDDILAGVYTIIFAGFSYGVGLSSFVN